MFDGFGSIVGAAGQIIGGLIQSSGQQAANAANIALSREQMDWQERMSNTAHRREVEDLRAAGLNPILSAKFGGASTPPGSLARVENIFQDAGQRGANTALALVRQDAEVDLLKAQAEQARATSTRERSQAMVNVASENNIDQDTRNKTQMNERIEQFLMPELTHLLANTEHVREGTMQRVLENRILPHKEVSARRVANEDSLRDEFRKSEFGKFLYRLRIGGEDVEPASRSLGRVLSGISLGGIARDLLRRRSEDDSPSRPQRSPLFRRR